MYLRVLFDQMSARQPHIPAPETAPALPAEPSFPPGCRRIVNVETAGLRGTDRCRRKMSEPKREAEARGSRDGSKRRAAAGPPPLSGGCCASSPRQVPEAVGAHHDFATTPRATGGGATLCPRSLEEGGHAGMPYSVSCAVHSGALNSGRLCACVRACVRAYVWGDGVRRWTARRGRGDASARETAYNKAAGAVVYRP